LLIFKLILPDNVYTRSRRHATLTLLKLAVMLFWEEDYNYCTSVKATWFKCVW